MAWCWRALLAPTIFLATACGYGPERTYLELHSFVAKPQSHQFAAALEYRRVKDPTGVINTFPNGGVGKVLFSEARIYLGDLDSGAIHLVATIPDFAGIPQPKAVQIEGWVADTLYFSLFGYGGNAWDGDDLSDERRIFYRATADGRVDRVNDVPPQRERQSNTGPERSPPFLRWTRGRLDVEIAIDARVSETVEMARLTFDTQTGKPRLSLP